MSAVGVTTRPRRRLNVMQMTDVTGRGGAEKALVDLALRIDRRRFNVTVCATRTTGNYQPMLDVAGVRTISLERHTSLQSYKAFGLVLLMRRERIDVLHTHLFGANTWGRVLGKLAGVPVIIAHEHWSTKADREIGIDRLLYRLNDLILVPSQASKQLVMQTEGIPARYLDVTYNGVDISLFSPDGCRDATRAEFGFSVDDTVVGSVGRLTADKGGQHDLMNAVSSLVGRYPRLKLLIVGDGPLRAELEQLAAERGLTEGRHVVFAGVRADVARLLGAMDIFVLPSHKEALPIAVLEAMSMGLPVIATKVGGVPEIVQHGLNGLLYEAGDTVALSVLLAHFFDNLAERARLASAGQALVRDQFTVDKMVEHVETLYERLYRQKRGTSRRVKR